MAEHDERGGRYMGLVERIERRLEATVGDAFARVFGGSIVPHEVETMLRREAEAGSRTVAGERVLAPNDYLITLSVPDYQKVSADKDLTAAAFARHLEGYIHDQGWQTYGDVVVRFEQSPNLHTGQFRARGAVNPDSSIGESAPAREDHAFTAESGVPAMTDNPSYRGGQGQGRPADEYYDERYGRQSEDRGPEQRGPEQREPEQRGAEQSEQRGQYPQEQGGGYPQRGGYPDQGGYHNQGYPPPPYEQRPPAGYGPPAGYDQGYRQGPGGYGPPPGYGQDYYGRPPGPGRYEDGGYGRQDPRYPDRGYPDRGYPDQGGYGGQYGRPDYGQQDYTRYGEPPAGYAEPARDYDYGQPAGGDYGQPAGGDYGQPGSGDYGQPPGDYGQPAGGDYAPPAGPQGGYGDYGQIEGRGEYASGAAAVTLQLDDGSGRTYQLREGANVIGRGQDAQFRLPDTGVSRRHLEIRWDGQVALLSDLNSTNGTTVNNAPVQEWQLADGDVIRLGHSEIIVRVH